MVAKEMIQMIKVNACSEAESEQNIEDRNLVTEREKQQYQNGPDKMNYEVQLLGPRQTNVMSVCQTFHTIGDPLDAILVGFPERIQGDLSLLHKAPHH